MKITIILDIPETELEPLLREEDMTREGFVKLITDNSSLLDDAKSITPGTTCTITAE